MILVKISIKYSGCKYIKMFAISSEYLRLLDNVYTCYTH